MNNEFLASSEPCRTTRGAVPSENGCLFCNKLDPLPMTSRAFRLHHVI